MTIDKKIIDAAEDAVNELGWVDSKGEVFPSFREDSPITDQVEAIKALVRAARSEAQPPRGTKI
jgi:hypothetical protein